MLLGKINLKLHNDKGKLVEKQGRKATGLRIISMIAGSPKRCGYDITISTSPLYLGGLFLHKK